NKMKAENIVLAKNQYLNNWVIIKHDLEDLRSPIEFVELIFKEVERYLSTLQKTTKKVNQFISKFKGIEIGEILKLSELPANAWKTLLKEIFDDLAEK